MTKSSRNFSSTPEKTFFKHHTDNISRIQSRLYGIRATPEELKIFLLSPTTAENINIRVSKILQNDTNIFRRLAYI